MAFCGSEIRTLKNAKAKSPDASKWLHRKLMISWTTHNKCSVVDGAAGKHTNEYPKDRKAL